MFKRVAAVISASFFASVLKEAAAQDSCSGARSLSLCAQFLTPFSQNSLTWENVCGVAAPASGQEMLMAQGLQFNTGTCAEGTTATCCQSCLACGNVGVDCTGTATAPPPPATGSNGFPEGWTVAMACAVDNADRVLSDITVTYSTSTTPQSCAASCAAQGFTFAGVEYSDECYCGDGYLDGVVPPTADIGDCDMVCAGDDTQFCGGPWRIQLYTSQ